MSNISKSRKPPAAKDQFAEDSTEAYSLEKAGFTGLRRSQTVNNFDHVNQLKQNCLMVSQRCRKNLLTMGIKAGGSTQGPFLKSDIHLAKSLQRI